MATKWTETKARKRVENGEDARLSGTVIYVRFPGIGTWGAIDYLVNKHSYKVLADK